MRCKAKTLSGHQCSNKGYLDGLCMLHKFPMGKRGKYKVKKESKK